MTACTGWSWSILLCVASAGFALGAIVISCFSVSAYNLGYEDALVDHGIPD